MKKHGLAALGLLLACGAFGKGEETSMQGFPLDGNWRVCTLAIDGQPGIQANAPGFQFHFTKDRLSYLMVVNGKPQRIEFAVTFDEDAQEIDAVVLGGRSMGRLCRGLYELNGDTLRIALEDAVDGPFKARPRSFARENGHIVQVFTLRRL